MSLPRQPAARKQAGRPQGPAPGPGPAGTYGPGAARGGAVPSGPASMPPEPGAESRGGRKTWVIGLSLLLLMIFLGGFVGWWFREPIRQTLQRSPALSRLLGLPQATAQGGVPLDPAALAQLQAALDDRSRQLDVREQQLADREAALVEQQKALKAREAELEQGKAELAAREAELAGREQQLAEREAALAAAEEAANAAAARDAELKAVYNEMRPQAVADALKTMSDSEALYILRLLEPDLVADVFKLMDPWRVARLTQKWMPSPAR